MIVIHKRAYDGYGGYGGYGQSVGEPTGEVLTRHERSVGVEHFTYGNYGTVEDAQAILDNAIVDAQNRGWTVYGSGIYTMLDGTYQPWIKAIPPEQELSAGFAAALESGALKPWPFEEEKTSYWPWIAGGIGILAVGGIIIYAAGGKKRK